MASYGCHCSNRLWHGSTMLRGGVSLTAGFCPISEVSLDTMGIPEEPIVDGHAPVRLGGPEMEVPIAQGVPVVCGDWLLEKLPPPPP